VYFGNLIIRTPYAGEYMLPQSAASFVEKGRNIHHGRTGIITEKEIELKTHFLFYAAGAIIFL